MPRYVLPICLVYNVELWWSYQLGYLKSYYMNNQQSAFTLCKHNISDLVKGKRRHHQILGKIEMQQGLQYIQKTKFAVIAVSLTYRRYLKESSHKAVSEVHCNERSAATICFSVFHVLVFLPTALPFIACKPLAIHCTIHTALV